MMISYLVIGFSGQAIVDYNIPDLFDLLGLAFTANSLKIEHFDDSAAEEDVVAAFDALFKSEKFEKPQHSGKGNVGVGISSENSVEQLVRARHDGKWGESVSQDGCGGKNS